MKFSTWINKAEADIGIVLFFVKALSNVSKTLNKASATRQNNTLAPKLDGNQLRQKYKKAIQHDGFLRFDSILAPYDTGSYNRNKAGLSAVFTRIDRHE